MLWVTFAWGSCFLAISIGLQDAPPLWLAALRVLIAAAALLLVVRVRRMPLPRGRRSWALIVLLGLVNIALAYGAMFASVVDQSTGAASVLANAQPLLILLPAWLLFREAPSSMTVAAMVVGVAGLLLIALPGGLGTGALLAVASAAAVTVGTLLARVLNAEPLVVAAWQLAIGGIVLALVAFLVEGPPEISWTARFIVVVLYMALVGTAATIVAWLTELRHARLDVLTAWTLLVPVFGILLSVFVLGERQTIWGWIGMTVVVLSLGVIVVGRHRAVRQASPSHAASSDDPTNS